MKFTPGQIGDANTPEAHLATAIPPAVDQTRDDDNQPANYSPRESRSYRAVSYGAPAPGPATEAVMGSQIAPHIGQGSPDPRAVWGGTAGHTGATHESLRTSPEVTDNSRALELVHDQAPIDRPRAGSVGTDPTRPSFMPRWLFFRPFDAWAQYGAAALDKIEQASPLASRPLAFSAPLAHALPSSGGSDITAMQPMGDEPNTTRTQPAPWDQQLTTANTDTSVSHAAAQRARGWGLR